MEPYILLVPLQGLQLRFSSQTGDRGLCHWLHFGLENKISDRKTVKLKGSSFQLLGVSYLK